MCVPKTEKSGGISRFCQPISAQQISGGISHFDGPISAAYFYCFLRAHWLDIWWYIRLPFSTRIFCDFSSYSSCLCLKNCGKFMFALFEPLHQFLMPDAYPNNARVSQRSSEAKKRKR